MSLEMDIGRAGLIIALTLIGVVIINVLIYFSIKGNRTHHQIELFRKASLRIKDPWEQEDSDLSELAELVKGLGNADDQPGRVNLTNEQKSDSRQWKDADE